MANSHALLPTILLLSGVRGQHLQMSCLLLEIVHNVFKASSSIVTVHEELQTVLGFLGPSGLNMGQVHSVFLTSTKWVQLLIVLLKTAWC